MSRPPQILQMAFELHLSILGTYPLIQMGSVDAANLMALLLRLGYKFVSWVPNPSALGVDCVELTILLDPSVRADRLADGKDEKAGRGAEGQRKRAREREISARRVSTGKRNAWLSEIEADALQH